MLTVRLWQQIVLLCGMAFCLLINSACDLVTAPLDNISFFASPTPPPAPTPVGNTLEFVVPQYPIELQMGQFIPGTTMQFIGKNGDNYSLKINGQSAESRVGNTWQWQGVIAPGVIGNYQLVLQRANADDRLVANGQVFLTVLQPSPVEMVEPQRTDIPLKFSGIKVNEITPANVTIPGTSLIYVAQSADGQIQFSGTNNYPLTAIGNTTSWRGLLRPNVYINNDLKVVGLETYGLRVTGSAELLVYPTLNP